VRGYTQRLTLGVARANKCKRGRDLVTGRLSALDLQKRLERFAPAPLIQVCVGLGLAALALALWGALRLPSGVAPFALLFPAILAATGLAGWQAGLLTLVSGALCSWRFLPGPDDPWALQPADGANLGLYVISGALVIAAAATYRRTVSALRESRERLDLATSAARLGVWEWRIDSDELLFSDEAKSIFGFPLDQPVTYEMIRAVTHPDDEAVARPRLKRALDPKLRDEEPYERRIVWPSGEVRWIYAVGRAVFEPSHPSEAAKRYVGVLQDVTNRKADEERMQLLAREVDHRANNLLAVVQGTVALSQAESAAALKSVITGRLNALARAHQLLAHGRWEGADLRRLVEEELLAFSLGDEARVWLSGPAVALAPAPAQSMAMALHELATNAAKYGALSTPCGRVEVNWSREAAGALNLTWRERGGPPVRAPNRSGLGVKLLARALAGTLGGETRLDWRPEGLVCELCLPSSALDSVAAPRDSDRQGGVTAASGTLAAAAR
jgi:PAS domain S-box-containing protein